MFNELSRTKKIVAICVIIIGILGISGFYTLSSGQEAVVLRFQKHVKTITTGGPKWAIPLIEDVIKVDVSEVKRLEFGYATIKEGSKGKNAEYKAVPEESLMLTGDENLALVEVSVQYQVADVEDYLFNVDDVIPTLKVASESIIRRVIASHPLDEALTTEKDKIQQEIKSELQTTCEKYKIGIAINNVQLQDVNPPQDVDAAFKDVSNAKEEKNSKINQAQSYSNEIIPKARGEASEMENKAEGYKQQRISEAKGDVANFALLYEKYKNAKDVTKTRMYLEAMEEILPGVEKYIVDGDGTMKFLPLTETIQPAQSTSTSSAK